MENTATLYSHQFGYLTQKQSELNIEYKTDDDNKEAYNSVMQYFTRHEDFLKRDESYSFDKGLLLFGNIGCGKTLLMKMFAGNVRCNYRVLNCREIASDFAINGDQGLEKYFVIQPANYLNKKPSIASICFDDLGTEPDKKYFGTDVNVLLEIMLRRYDKGDFFRTHGTTNLTPTDIKTRYGERLSSRFREMFNLIKFPANAIDRRK